MKWLRMNIIYLFIRQIKVSLCALNQHLWRLRYALRKHLSSLVELVGNHRVRTISRARYVLLLLIIIVIVAIEIGLLLVGRTIEECLPMTESLVVQLIKMLAKSKYVLRLLRNNVLALAILRIENRGQLLGHWDGLGSRLLLSRRVHLIAF